MTRKVLTAISILVVVIIAILWEDVLEQRHSEYKEIKIEKDIEGIVEDIEEFRGTSFISLNEKKISIPNSRNNTLYNYSLAKFLQKGDHIKKNAGSDTLEVSRGGKLYYFVIGDLFFEKEPVEK